jgi:hypothetical protein
MTEGITLLASKKGGHCTTETSLEEYGTSSKSLSLNSEVN